MKRHTCGAKTRAGGTCQRQPLSGKKRCRLHGGLSPGAPKGNRNAATPGSLHSKYLTEEEQAIAAGLELGSVDEELRLTRIRLMRVLQREQERDRRAEQIRRDITAMQQRIAELEGRSLELRTGQGRHAAFQVMLTIKHRRVCHHGLRYPCICKNNPMKPTPCAKNNLVKN